MIKKIVLFNLFLLMLAMGCTPAKPTRSMPKSEATAIIDTVRASYRLGSGDKLGIKVFNQDAFAGEYTIDGTGNVSLPLIGSVSAKDLTLEEFTERLKNKLSPDFLLNPRISVQVLNYRPFYILGEVNKPASYPYVSGMTYLTAVAIAGGFTYRAREEYVFVVRDNDPNKQEIKISIDNPVLPGDIIRVDERMF